jgi:polysaccharide biosynthesis transport protein
MTDDLSSRVSGPTRGHSSIWPLMFGSLAIGASCAAVVGAMVWLLIGDRYTASAYVRVDVQEMSILGQPPNTFDRERFEVFRNSQREMVLSRPVLTAALRKPDVAKIPKIQEEQRTGDAVDWLQRQLCVGFPGKAEFMQVSITRPDPHEAVVLVNAVVDSYLTDVIDADRRLKQDRLNKLESACADKETQIRTTRSELKNLAAINGIGPEAEVMTQRQKMIIEEYSLRNQQKAKMEFDLGDLQAQVAAQQALLRNIDSTEPPAEEVDAALHADPTAQGLLQELTARKVRQLLAETGDTKKRAAPPDGSSPAPGEDESRAAQRLQKEITVLQRALDEKRAEATKKVQDRQRKLVAAELTKVRNQYEVKRAQFERLYKDVDKLRDEASRIGSTSVDVEMLARELKQKELIAQELNSQREIMRVDLQSAPRITLSERAEQPLTPSNSLSRALAALLSTLAVFPLAALVVFLCGLCLRRAGPAGEQPHRD